MSEFFIELFSEEIPANLQNKTRQNFFQNLKEFLEKEDIKYSGEATAFSIPNRLIVYFQNISKKIIKKENEIRGPNINAPEDALNGFLKSYKISIDKTYKKKTDKGEFYFFKKPSESIETKFVLQKNLPKILDKISWKKSMRWADHELYWGRPLKSILCCFDNKTLEFVYHHLVSSNITFIDKDFEQKTKKFVRFKDYLAFFKSQNIILDNKKREQFIVDQLNRVAKKENLKIHFNSTLLNEVTNIVEKPNIIKCRFNKRFLEIPDDILVTTMQVHQKYFPTFDRRDNLTNNFF